jgi:uncharacterized caspase-like protein
VFGGTLRLVVSGVALAALLHPAARAQQATEAEQRVALVIGNGAYQQDRLRNPVNDATDMAESLRELGFKVILRTDANQRQMKRSLREFRTELRRGGVAMFYYAGHGVQHRGRNYLIPVGADIEAESDIEDESVDANLIMGYMEEAGTRVNIVVLDACRNNPFARSFRSSSRGLVVMESGAKGTFVAYATAPGSVAFDGDGRNGLYTKHLLASLKHADSDIERVFKRVRSSVAEETRNAQIPWDSSSLLGDFRFRPEAPRGAAAGTQKAPAFFAPRF